MSPSVVLVIVGFFIGIFFHRNNLQKSIDAAQSDSEKILEEAHLEKEQIIKGAQQEAQQKHRQKRQQFEVEAKKKRGEITKLEQKIRSREQSIEKKLSMIDKKENDLEKMTEHLNREEAKYTHLVEQAKQTYEQNKKNLETVANMSQEEAKRELIKSLEIEAKAEAKERLIAIEEETKENAERLSRSMVSLAVQRVSSEYVNDSTITVVGLPSDEMKGRIIGREGRNIRAIEQATGIDLIIDDTPEAVILSCFNPIRREIAKISLERLIADGRIHPARIDETVDKVSQEFDQIIMEIGEQASFDTGITDLHPELIKYLGRLKFRNSGQQTVLQHSIEVAHIAGIMAAEMGLDIKKAKRAGLLHDIGKAADQEVEGHHAAVGAELCQRYNEAADIVSAVETHHNDDLTFSEPLNIVIHAANVLSGRRPGARREVLETYIKRLIAMEDIVNSFDGIQESFVIQAGREIRAMVSPSGVSDQDVLDLSHDIAHRLRKELTFPGQVKVTVLRESKQVDFAK